MLDVKRSIPWGKYQLIYRASAPRLSRFVLIDFRESPSGRNSPFTLFNAICNLFVCVFVSVCMFLFLFFGGVFYVHTTRVRVEELLSSA